MSSRWCPFVSLPLMGIGNELLVNTSYVAGVLITPHGDRKHCDARLPPRLAKPGKYKKPWGQR